MPTLPKVYGKHGKRSLKRAHPKCSKPIIGLVGGIGAGKTSVAKILESLGTAIIDSDRLSHEQFRDPEVVAALCEWWGDRVLAADGTLDRGAIGSIVFSDRSELERLEGLLYPRIGRRRNELLAQFDADPDVLAIALDAPKLLEAGLQELCDAIVFVEASWSDRVRRVGNARGWTEQELKKREILQDPLDKKKAVADHLVFNHSGIDELQSQVERVFSSVLAAFA